MNRKMVRRIIVFIGLVGIAGVFFLIKQNTDTGPKKVYNEPSEEVMQKVREGLAARKAQGAAKPPPAGETHETGHWDGDRWHRTVPHITKKTSPSTEDQPKSEVVQRPEKINVASLVGKPLSELNNEELIALSKLYADPQSELPTKEASSHLRMIIDEQIRRHNLLVEELSKNGINGFLRAKTENTIDSYLKELMKEKD